MPGQVLCMGQGGVYCSLMAEHCGNPEGIILFQGTKGINDFLADGEQKPSIFPHSSLKFPAASSNSLRTLRFITLPFDHKNLPPCTCVRAKEREESLNDSQPREALFFSTNTLRLFPFCTN